MSEASSIYDLLSIGMARRGQYAMLSEVMQPGKGPTIEVEYPIIKGQ